MTYLCQNSACLRCCMPTLYGLTSLNLPCGLEHQQSLLNPSATEHADWLGCRLTIPPSWPTVEELLRIAFNRKPPQCPRSETGSVGHQGKERVYTLKILCQSLDPPLKSLESKKVHLCWRPMDVREDCPGSPSLLDQLQDFWEL